MKARVSSQHKMFLVDYDARLAGMISKAVDNIVGGKRYLAVPHTESATLAARSLGYDVPAPIEVRYAWPKGPGRTPRETQIRTAAEMTLNPRMYVLNEFGTGKTRSALYAFDWLHAQKRATRMLISAPLSTLARVWMKEILSTTPRLKGVVLHGSAEKRKKLLADKGYDIYIINPEGLATIYDDVMARPDIDAILIDELALFRNPSAQRTKYLRKMASTRKWVWGMTGSPMPSGMPTDVYAQAKIVTPNTVSMSYVSFRDMTELKVNNFKWVPRKTGVETAFRVLQPAVRFSLTDVIELPDIVFRQEEVEQSRQQQDAYKELAKHTQTMIDRNEVTAANAAVLMGKLLQVSLGWVYGASDSEGGERPVAQLPNDGRLQALVDSIESTSSKVIVYVPYIHALAGVSARLKRAGYSVETVSGATPAKERTRIFRDFQESDEPHVLVAHPQCMAHGITLTASDTIIWLGPFPSLEVFDQANARIRRIGQDKKQQVIMLYGTPVERKLYERLRERRQFQTLLLDMFKSD